MANKAVEKRQQAAPAKVDPRDEPSAEWGWHGGFPKGGRIAGWLTVIVLLAMIYNNHENNTENVWLVGTAIAIAAGLLWDIRKRRTSWRR